MSWYVLCFPILDWPQYDMSEPFASEGQAKAYNFDFSTSRYIIMEASSREGIQLMIQSQIEACDAVFGKDAREAFYIRQSDEPSEDELIQQQAIRAIVSCLTDTPIEKLTSGWTVGHKREFRCSAHREYIPYNWIRHAEALVRTGLIRYLGYHWDGEIEEEQPRESVTVDFGWNGKRYKGVAYAEPDEVK